MARATKGTEALLMWCKKNSEGYKDVNVKDFHLSWRDGLAFCALIHKFRPELIPFSTLAKENCSHNLGLAFKVGDDIGIPALLDVEDMLIEPRPDTFSVITYLSQYYHFFTKPANCTSYGGSGVATITFDPSSASTNTSKPGIDPAAIAKENERLQKENERKMAENEKIRKENERRVAENEKRLREWNARNSTNLQGGGGSTTSGLAPQGSLGACVVCKKDLSGNIIEFTGKSYHQDCFKCHSCSRAFATNVQGNIQAICVEGWPYCERCGKVAFIKSRSRPPSTTGVKIEEERKNQEEEKKRRQEEDRKKLAEDEKKLEEEKRIEEKRKEEEKKREDERKRDEERKRETEKKRQEDETRRKQEEEERRKKQEEDKRKKQEEDKKRQDELKQRQEEQKKKQEEERKKQEEVARQRREDEVQRKEVEDKKKKDLEQKQEERKRKEESDKKRLEDDRKRKEEEERKRKESAEKQQAESRKLEELKRKKEDEEKKAKREAEEKERKQKEEREKQRLTPPSIVIPPPHPSSSISPRKDDKIKRLTDMFENPSSFSSSTPSPSSSFIKPTKEAETKGIKEVEIREVTHETLNLPSSNFTLKPSPTSIYVAPKTETTSNDINNNNNNNNNNKINKPSTNINNNNNNNNLKETPEEKLKRMADERAKRFRESEERARKAQEERDKKAKEERLAANNAKAAKPPTTDVTPTKTPIYTNHFTPTTITTPTPFVTPPPPPSSSSSSSSTETSPRSNSGKKPLPPPPSNTSPSNSFLSPSPSSTSTSPSNSFLSPSPSTPSSDTSPSNSFLTPTSTPTSANTSNNDLLSPASPSPNRRRNVTLSIDRTKKGVSQLNVIHNIHVNTGQNEIALAEYDFVAEENNELTFHAGDQIELLATHRDSEWAEGRVARTGQVGWFLPELTNLYYHQISSSSASDQFLRESVRSAIVLSPGPELLPMLQEAALDFSFIPTCDGYLLKQNSKKMLKQWQRRWFSLQEDQIVYYLEEQEKFMTGKESPPYGLIYLRFVRSVTPTADQKFIIHTPERSYHLQAETDQDRDRWVYYINLVMKRMQLAPANADRKPQKKEGWLRKLSRFGKWKRRWIVVQGGVVFWFKSRGAVQVGKIPLYHASLSVMKILEEYKPDEQTCSFTVTSPTDNSRSTFQAEKMHMWLNAIQYQKIIIEEKINCITFV